MYNYSRDSIPPAPVIPIEISKPSTPDDKLPKLALIDSGADMSALPPSLIDELGLTPIREVIIQGSTGIGIRPIYVVNILFHGTSFRYLSVMGMPDEDLIVIGRDILNSFHICLDGINENTTFQD